MDSVSNWIKSRPRLNAEKTKVMWCASSRRQSQLPRCPITVAGAVLPHYDSFIIYVATSPTTAFVLSWSRSSTRGSITATSCLSGFLPISNDVCRPHSQRRSAARLVFRLHRYDDMSDSLPILHWLRLPERVNFKLALIAYRVLNGMVSSYLNKLVSVSRSSPSSVVVHAAAVQRTTHGVVVRALDS